MSDSLRDQLLKAGLATPEQARRTSKKSGKKSGNKASKKARAQKTLTPEQQAAKEAARKKAARDKALEAKRKQREELLDMDNTVRQLVERHGLKRPYEGETYNFMLDGRIHSLQVTGEQRRDLAAGRLSIVSRAGIHHVVPHPIGDRIAEKVPEWVWRAEPESDEPDPDDPYADYKVPDDLIW